MGTRVGRSTLFGIPLQQQWSYGNSGDYAPTYYLHSDAPLYYYSFTDAFIAQTYRSLPADQQARFDPMITGFNPADMYGADHIKRVLRAFPGVFSGIGEFSIHKEFVSPKVAGETASLTNPALDRILDFAAEIGLAVILHNDIDMPFAKTDAEPVYLHADQGAPEAASEDGHHLGPHRPRPRGPSGPGVGSSAAPRSAAPTTSRSSRRCSTDPALSHVDFDISWDEVAKYAVSVAGDDRRRGRMLNKLPRSLSVRHRHRGPAGPAPYFAVFDMWAPVCERLTPEASAQGSKGQLRADFRRSAPPGPCLGGSQCKRQ